MSEQPAAEWAHQETGGEQHGGVELRDHRIAVREEQMREIKRERRVGIEVVPLDQIADGADENRLQAATYVGRIERLVRGRAAAGNSLFNCHGQRLEIGS